jgi:hypothetical protein
MNNKIILSAFAALAINTNVIAGFFDNLVDNLKTGDLNSLVTDLVADVTNEIDEAQDDSDIKSNTESSGSNPTYQKVGSSLGSGSKVVGKTLEGAKNAIDSFEKYAFEQDEKYPKLTGFYQYSAFSESQRDDYIGSSYPLRYERNKKALGLVDNIIYGKSSDKYGSENILKMKVDSCKAGRAFEAFEMKNDPVKKRYSKYRKDRVEYEAKANAGDMDAKAIIAALDILYPSTYKNKTPKEARIEATKILLSINLEGDQIRSDILGYGMGRLYNNHSNFFLGLPIIEDSIKRLEAKDRGKNIRFSTGTVEDLKTSKEWLMKRVQLLACKNSPISKRVIPFVYLMKNTPESVKLATRARVEKIQYCKSVLSDDECNFYRNKFLTKKFIPFFKNAQETLKLDDVTLGFIKLEGLDGTVDIEAAIGHFGEYLSEHFPSEEIQENAGHLILTPENQEVVYIYDVAMSALEKLTKFAIKDGDEALMDRLFTLRTEHLFYKHPVQANRLSEAIESRWIVSFNRVNRAKGINFRSYKMLKDLLGSDLFVIDKKEYKKYYVTYPSDLAIKLGQKKAWITYKQKQAKKTKKPSNNARGKIVL